MTRPTVKLNLPGLNAVLRSAQPVLDAHGRRMAMAAGDGFEYQPKPHRWTARGFVQTADRTGRKRQSDEAVLERVMGSR